MPNTGDITKVLLVIPWDYVKPDKFPTSYGEVDFETFCYKVKESLLKKKNIETEVAYKGAGNKRKVCLRRKVLVEVDRNAYRKTPLVNKDGSRIRIIKDDACGHRKNNKSYGGGW